MSLLTIRDLRAGVDDKEIISGLNLTINPGEVHVIMGPNGSGKSTLVNVLAGNETYEPTAGSVDFDGVDLLALDIEERCLQGIFMAFQYPVEIPGVTLTTLLRHTINNQREYRKLPPLDPISVVRKARAVAKKLNISEDILKRGVNESLSGGEKKRSEVLQMALMEPRLVLMDETDSGLDVDALRSVASAVNEQRSPERSFLIVTHYRRLLDYVSPDVVHIMMNGKLVAQGDFSLVEKVEADGYETFS